MSGRPRGVGGMSSAVPSEALRLSSDASPLTSKELLIGRIKHNFALETQSCRQRELRAPTESQNEEGELQSQVRRLKRRCAKLERRLQEKEAEIHALQDQQQLRFPLLMHETMRNLRSLEDNQSDRSSSAMPLALSVVSDRAHERRDADARIHEYERQIAELYEENQQEKLKNEMLSECLRDQKHAKAKLMKACKHVKQELQAVKDSGLSQMLVDIEARCDAVEKDKARVVEDLSLEISLRKKKEAEHEILAKQHEDLLVESNKWEYIVARKDQHVQQLRDQICDQQVTIENLKTDLKIVEKRSTHPAEHPQDDQEEIEQLKNTITMHREKLEDAQAKFRQLTTENGFLREQLAAHHGEPRSQDNTASCVDQGTVDELLIQVRFIKNRVRALKELVQMYDETNAVDMNLLDDGYCEDAYVDDAADTGTYAIQLSSNVLEAARYLAELQQVVEDVCARLMGSNCALQ